MAKILIMGNSGSGKSTLAQRLVKLKKLAHLDLDTLAWLPEAPPRRMPVTESTSVIDTFIGKNAAWVIEGCYADLLALLVDAADELVFLNIPIAQCVANARNRPWEPHKYPSREAQDANLEMLVSWIGDYQLRQDELSYIAHRRLFDLFKGHKIEFTSIEELNSRYFAQQ